MRVTGGDQHTPIKSVKPKSNPQTKEKSVATRAIKNVPSPKHVRTQERIYTIKHDLTTRKVCDAFSKALQRAEKHPTAKNAAKVAKLFTRLKFQMPSDSKWMIRVDSKRLVDHHGRIHTIEAHLGKGGYKSVSSARVSAVSNQSFRKVATGTSQAYAFIKPGMDLDTNQVRILKTLQEGQQRGVPGAANILVGSYHELEGPLGTKGQLIIQEECAGDLQEFFGGGYLYDNEDLHTHCASIADQLAACHEMGIAHRDISADNIMIAIITDPDTGESSPVARLADFDLACSIKEPTGMPGKPDCMAPEFLTGAEIKDLGKADVYSMGVMLTQIYHADPFMNAPFFQFPASWDGSYPEQTTKEKGAELIEHRRTQAASNTLPTEISRPSWMSEEQKGPIAFLPNRADPNHVDHLLAKMLDPDPEKRPTMSEVATFLRQEGLQAPPNYFDE